MPLLCSLPVCKYLKCHASPRYPNQLTYENVRNCTDKLSINNDGLSFWDNVTILSSEDRLYGISESPDCPDNDSAHSPISASLQTDRNHKKKSRSNTGHLYTVTHKLLKATVWLSARACMTNMLRVANERSSLPNAIVERDSSVTMRANLAVGKLNYLRLAEEYL